MRHILILLFTFVLWGKCFGQAHQDSLPKINNFSITPTGFLKFNITYTGNDLKFKTEQLREGKWVSLGISGMSPLFAQRNPPKSTFTDSGKVVLYEGINKFRVHVLVPAQAISKEFEVTK